MDSSVQNSLKSKTISSLFYKFTEQFTLLATQLVVTIILARLLTPSEYGLIGLLTVFAVIANAFIETGFCTGVIQKKNLTKTDCDTAFWLCIISSITIYAVFFFIAPLFSRIYKNDILCKLLRVYVLIIIPGGILSYYNSILSRRLDYKKQFWGATISGVISGGLGIYLAYIGKGVWALVFQYISNKIVFLMIIVASSKIVPKFSFSFQSAKEITSFSWKMSARRLIGVTIDQLRNLIIGKVYSKELLGFYTKGQMFPTTVATATDYSLQSVLFSAYSKKQDDIQSLKQMVRRSVQVSSYILFPSMLGIAAISKQLVLLLLSDKWLPAVPFMQITCIYCLFQPVNSANSQAINALGRSDITLKIEILYRVFSLFIIIVSSFFSVYVFALCAILDISTLALLYLFANRKFLHYSVTEQLSDITPNFILSIIMGLFVYGVSVLSSSLIITLIFQIATGILTYIILSIIFKNKSFFYLKSESCNSINQILKFKS